MEKECCICGKKFITKSRRKVCSNSCRKKKDTLYHRKWVSNNLEKNRTYMRDYMRTGKIH